jgi:hypothetical protein
MKNNSESNRVSRERTVPPSPDAKELVREALQSEHEGLDRMLPPRMYLVRLFARIEQLSADIDEAFGGQPLSLNLAPDAPANVTRCKAYLRLHKENTDLLGRALELWMFSFGYVAERRSQSKT